MTNTPYFDSGSGDALVFLHGFCESKEVWTEFVKPLQHKFRIIGLDLPGFGNKENLDGNFSMEFMAETVQQQLHTLGVKKCILVGHSMGGYVAMAFAEKFGTMLSGLCLFHSSALPDTQEKKDHRNKSIDYIKRHGVDNFINPFIAPLFYQGNRSRLKSEIELMKQIGRQTPIESVLGALAAMRDRPDRTKVLEKIKYPVLFIFGKEDGAIPLVKALEQCHLPANSMVYFLGNTGHMSMFERPYETRKAIEKFAETIYG